MTRNAEGKIVPQCAAKRVEGANHVRCVLERGHAEQHEDARGNWPAPRMDEVAGRLLKK